MPSGPQGNSLGLRTSPAYEYELKAWALEVIATATLVEPRLRLSPSTGLSPKPARFEGSTNDRVADAAGTAATYGSYVVEKGATSMAKDTGEMARRISDYTARGPNGVPRADKLREVARLQQLTRDAKAVAKTANAVGNVGTVAGTRTC